MKYTGHYAINYRIIIINNIIVRIIYRHWYICGCINRLGNSVAYQKNTFALN